MLGRRSQLKKTGLSYEKRIEHSKLRKKREEQKRIRERKKALEAITGLLVPKGS